MVEPFANDVLPCPACQRLASRVEAARVVAAHLAPRSERESTWAYIGYPGDPLEPAIVRAEYPELCMEIGPPDGSCAIESLEVPALPRTVAGAMLDLGDAVRVILDSGQPDPKIRRSAEIILEASEHVREHVPALRSQDAAALEEREAMAAGLFVALVEVARRYCLALDASSPQYAIDVALVGLRENLEDDDWNTVR